MRGFSKTTAKRDLLYHFDPTGRLTSDIIMKDRFAFIIFKRHEDALAVVKNPDLRFYNNMELLVQESSSDRSRKVANNECWTCGSRNHWARECAYSKNGIEANRRDIREGRCFNCQEKGHIKRDCPEIGGRWENYTRDRERYRSSSRNREKIASYRRHLDRVQGHSLGRAMGTPSPRRLRQPLP